MPQIKVCCEPSHLQTLLAKMALRASTKLDPKHPYYGLTAAQFEPVLWERVQELLTRHCLNQHTDPLVEYAFILDAPLNDTVFMCTGVHVPANLPQATFSVQHLPGGGTDFMLDFYSRL